jgi:hypothetical protein
VDTRTWCICALASGPFRVVWRSFVKLYCGAERSYSFKQKLGPLMTDELPNRILNARNLFLDDGEPLAGFAYRCI